MISIPRSSSLKNQQACPQGGLVEGGVYANRYDWLRWSYLKILKLDEDVAHVRFYKLKSWLRPLSPARSIARLGVSAADRDFALGHVPLSRHLMEDWETRLLVVEEVEAEELEGYEMWKEADGGVFD